MGLTDLDQLREQLAELHRDTTSALARRLEAEREPVRSALRLLQSQEVFCMHTLDVAIAIEDAP